GEDLLHQATVAVEDEMSGVTESIGLRYLPSPSIVGALSLMAKGIAHNRLPTGLVMVKFRAVAQFINLSCDPTSGVILCATARVVGHIIRCVVWIDRHNQMAERVILRERGAARAIRGTRLPACRVVRLA